MFGPGLLGTLGEYIWSSNNRNVNKILSRGAASEAKENVEPSVLDRALAGYE